MEQIENQLSLPFELSEENIAYTREYNFEKLKKIFLPNNPLYDNPLFLTVGSRVVNDSRKYFKYKHLNKEKGVKPVVDADILNYQIGDFKIVASLDYGLPDEFDGLVWDTVMMIISKFYIKSNKTFEMYRISEGSVMDDLVKRGLYKKSGTLLKRIKYALNRLQATNYVIESKIINKKGQEQTNEARYRLIDLYLRKGLIVTEPDGSKNEISQTLIVPSSVILISLNDKDYHIIANEIRYNLERYTTKTIHDRLFRTVVTKILQHEVSINLTSKSYVNFVISYQKFCDWNGIIPLSREEQRESKITTELKNNYFDDLIKNNVIDSFYVKKTSKDKEFNIIFLFNPIFIDTIFNVVISKLKNFSLKSVDKHITKAYYAKLERQIKNKEILDQIKKGLPEKVTSDS